MGFFFSHASGIVGFNGLNFLFKLFRVKHQCNSYLQIKFLHIIYLCILFFCYSFAIGKIKQFRFK
jgi:hypothetical protein